MIPFPVEYYARQKPSWQVGLERLALLLRFLLLLGVTLWAAGALYYDLPVARLRAPAAALFGLAALLLFIFVKQRLHTTLLILGGFAAVLAWWLTIKPSNDRAWQTGVDRTAWAEIDGDRVTVHNVRNFDYRSATDFTPVWETRSYDLSQLKGVDLFINYWGSKFMAHPIMSFVFTGDDRLCMSIETRMRAGESYSAIGGIYRQYELIYLAGDERDFVRVRTNYRKGEEVFLYHLRMPPARAREVLLDYLNRMNSLHEQPEFYNAVTSNCTTNIRTQSAKTQPWDWRILLNGFADKMIYSRGDFAGDLPFDELKRRALINPAALAADAAPDFSERIRDMRPGF
jgi:hypothetical protein